MLLPLSSLPASFPAAVGNIDPKRWRVFLIAGDAAAATLPSGAALYSPSVSTTLT